MRFTRAFLLILVPALTWADFNSSDRGTTTANFLKLGVGARAEAMGEAYSAVADDASALYWNPAGLTRIDGQSATFMHAPYLVSTYYDYGAYARRWGNHAFGAGVQYFSAGSIPETDENNTSLGSYSPYDLATSLGYAYQFSENGLAVGVVAKYIRSKIIDSANAFAVDFGAQTRWYGDRLRLAFTTVNLGSKMKFDQDSESLPLALRCGSAFRITRHWLASFDLISPKDNATYAALGTEYSWFVRDGISLAGRMGYNSLTAGDISGFTGVSFGFGLAYQTISFDYALLPYGGLGITHRISLSFKWGGEDRDGMRRTKSSPSNIIYPSGSENLP